MGCQQKNTMDKQLYQLKGSLVELVRAGESTSQFDGTYAEVSRREQIATEKYHKTAKYHSNLANLYMICERNPPHMPALIKEVEDKLDQDADLLAEIKKRLWEQKFEHNTHIVKFKEMKALVREGVSMHEQLLEYRMQAKKRMQQQAAEDTALLNAKKNEGTFKTTKRRMKDKEKSQDLSDAPEQNHSHETIDNWQEKWDVIATRTGIDDPNIFFKRINERQILEDQISLLRKTAETKLEQLKRDSTQVEADLEEVRVEASILGGHGREIYQKGVELASANQDLRRKTELTESYEHLQKKAWEGLRHISEMLGEPVQGLESLPTADAASQMTIKNCVENIDKVLEHLMEEKEKIEQSGMSQESGSHSRIGTGKESNPESPSHPRNAELVHVLDWVESPKARLPVSLGFDVGFKCWDSTSPQGLALATRGSKKNKYDAENPHSSRSDADKPDDESENEGMWNRNFAKTALLKNSMRLIKEDEKEKKKHEPAEGV